MHDPILPLTFLNLLAEFRGVFTAPSFENFRVLVSGFVHSLGRHGVSDAIRAAGPAAHKHYSAYYRFFSRATWSLDEFGLCLLGLVIGALYLVGVEVELVLDDTLTRGTGKKVALATMHADPLRRQGKRPFMAYGHVFVVLSVHVRLPLLAPTGWALPFMFRLYQGSKRGGRDDSPSDRGRAFSRRRQGKAQRKRVRLTDLTVIEGQLQECMPRPDDEPLPDDMRKTKLQLATEMLLKVAAKFPNVQFRILADHLYGGKAVLHEVHSNTDNMHFTIRGQSNAALYELPPPYKGGGRPRVKGTRLPNPEQWASQNPDAFEWVEVTIYGKLVEVMVASFVGMPYRSLPGRLVRYVIVKDVRGIYKTDYIFDTNIRTSAIQIVEAYARRWPLERSFQDTKQKLGMEQHQTQLPASVRRCAPFSMLTYSLVVLWYLQAGHHLAKKMTTHHDPWYQKTARPSFTEMLACLRRASWSEVFLDPPLEGGTRQKSLAEYVMRVVASG